MRTPVLTCGSALTNPGPYPSTSHNLARAGYGLAQQPRGGYGHVRIFDGYYPVHRLIFMVENGFLPDSLFVLHKCDNRLCVRSSHLFPGTQKENIADAIQKGRIARGESLPQTKLTEASVIEIKKALAGGSRGIELAKLFGVNQSTICDIKKGRKWSWLRI